MLCDINETSPFGDSVPVHCEVFIYFGWFRTNYSGKACHNNFDTGCFHTHCGFQMYYSLITQHLWVVFGPPKTLISYEYICRVWINQLTPVVYHMNFDILLRYATIFLGLLAGEILF